MGILSMRANSASKSSSACRAFTPPSLPIRTVNPCHLAALFQSALMKEGIDRKDGRGAIRNHSRRNFVKQSSWLLGAVVAAPMILPQRVWGANSRLRIAWIGLGGQGCRDLRRAVNEHDLVALCDCDRRAMNSPQMMEAYPKAKRYQDFRIMLAELGDSIDAVGISSTDTLHFPAAYMAIHMGKHVFVQKPLTHTIWEARTLQHLAAEKGVVTQMGNQGHASEGARLVKEWYQGGLIGEVREVIAWTNRPAAGVGFGEDPAYAYPSLKPVPDGLDWDLWLGPSTADVGYNPALHPVEWRRWWAFGAGGLGDIGCHTIDTAYWALDLPQPESIEVAMHDTVNPIHTPLGSVVTFNFPARGNKPPVKIKWYEGPTSPEVPSGFDGDLWQDRNGGFIMVGEDGGIFHPGMRPDSPRLYPQEKWQAYRSDRSSHVPKTLPRVKDGITDDWLDAIREGRKACSDFSYAAPLTELILLGTLSIRTGRAVRWDPENMKVPGNPEAETLIRSEARPGWGMRDLV
jgi:predicted dehydrogenase